MTVFIGANHWTLSFAKGIEAAIFLSCLQETRECICRVWHDNKKLFPFNIISVCVEFMVSKPYRAHPTWLMTYSIWWRVNATHFFHKQFSFGSYVPFLRSRCYSHHPVSWHSQHMFYHQGVLYVMYNEIQVPLLIRICTVSFVNSRFMYTVSVQ